MKISAAILALQAASISAFAPNSALHNPIPTSKVVTTKRPSFHQDVSLKMSTETPSPTNIFTDFLGGLFKNDAVKEKEEEKPKIPDVVISSDYTLTAVFGAIGAFVIATSLNSPLGIFEGSLDLLFAVFLAVQASRIRFVFDETAFELKNVDIGASDDAILTTSGENFVVGGANRWAYETFVNWDFFPSEQYPVLVYFKETQTPQDKWNEGPGQLDKVGGGQLHFFPAIANVKELKEQFELRGCGKIDSE